MKIIILGAGASNDVRTYFKDTFATDFIRNSRLEHQFWGPPLGNNLFDTIYEDILDHYSSAKAISGTIINRMVTNKMSLEESLETILVEADKKTKSSLSSKRAIANIKYYLQQLLLTCSEASFQAQMNYAKLIYQLEQSEEDFCIITFNYDTLLEKCMTASTTHGFNNMSQYTNHRNIKIIKVHGSCNWHRYIYNEIEYDRGVSDDEMLAIISEKPHLALQDFSNNLGNFHIHDNILSRSMDRNDKPNVLLVPAIALPVATRKNRFECPDDHLETMRECLQKADKILSIGWRGAEKKFMTELEKYLPVAVKWTVVSREESGCEDTIANIKKHLHTSQNGKIKTRGDVFNKKTGGFSGYMDGNNFAEFLK